MLTEPNCHKRSCRNYLGHEEIKGIDKHICEAYPLGIPDDIAYGEDLHLEERSDQFGMYVFNPPP